MKFILNIKPSPLKRYRFKRSAPIYNSKTENIDEISIVNPIRTYNSQIEEMKEVSFLIKSQFITHTCHTSVFTGALSIDITFFMQIPGSYSKLKKNRLNGEYHTHKKDLDNLIKFLADCITMSGIIKDDCQFAVINAKKIWAVEGKIEFEIKDI